MSFLFLLQMPQTVPSAGYNSPYCDYSAFTTDFDLSLLPESPESEVPLSPNNLSPYSYLYPSSPPMFSTNLEDGILCDSLGFVSVKSKVTGEVKAEFDDEPLHTPLKKSPSSGFFVEKKQKDEKFDYFMKNDEQISGEPLIPTTVQATANYFPLTIKEEPSFGLEFGHSDFQSIRSPPSPFAIKTEKVIDLKETVKESQYPKSPAKYEADSKQYATLRSLLKTSVSESGEATTEAKVDHQLLRSVLRDTSFQKKFNLKPFDLLKTENLIQPSEKDVKMEEENGSAKSVENNEIVEELTSEKIEPVFSLAIEQIRKDVDNTCNVLGISSGEYTTLSKV